MERKGTGPSISPRPIVAVGAASVLCAAAILYLRAGVPDGSEVEDARLPRDPAPTIAPPAADSALARSSKDSDSSPAADFNEGRESASHDLVTAREATSSTAPDTSRYANAGLVDVRRRIPNLLINLKYAGSDNLLGQPIYSDLSTCYLQPEVVRMLAVADSTLRARRPDLRLLLYDCARPLEAQWRLWELVRGTPLQRYVANPSRGSMHNYGTAVDLTLATAAGAELDMGTPYDFLGPESQPREEDRLFREGRLTEHQLSNRKLLRTVMTEAGFHPIAIEWWHFEAFEKERTRREYTIIP